MSSCQPTTVHVYESSGSVIYNVFGIQPLANFMTYCPSGYFVSGLNLYVTPFIAVAVMIVALAVPVSGKRFRVLFGSLIGILSLVYLVSAILTYSRVSSNLQLVGDSVYHRDLLSQLMLAIPIQFLMNIVFFILVPFLMCFAIRQFIPTANSLLSNKIESKNAKN